MSNGQFKYEMETWMGKKLISFNDDDDGYLMQVQQTKEGLEMELEKSVNRNCNERP